MKRATSTSFTSNSRGGARQRVAKHAAEVKASKVPSQLAMHLLSLWGWGLMSTPQVQHIMKLAKADMDNLVAGTLDMDDIDMITNIGCGGQYAGNTLRDLNIKLGKAPLHDAMHRFRIPLKSDICALGTIDREQTLILPHIVFATLYHAHRSDWETVISGPPGALERFWSDMVLSGLMSGVVEVCGFPYARF
jgi:hypothetical protein